MNRVESSRPDLHVLPLGGCGEVGLNATLLTFGNSALLVDCGLLFGAPDEPGVDKTVPGFEPLFEPGLRLEGVVLTHGHQDHVGALPALLAEREVPVFGTPLTIALARARMEPRFGPTAEEARRQAVHRLFEVRYGDRITLGPFVVEWIRVTHSLPEAAALFIECPGGRVLHSGDFRLDATPIDGRPTDIDRLRAIGDSGVDLLLSDSTNAERPGRGASEQEVRTEIERQVLASEGRVVVSCIASHMHRLQSILDAAQRAGRRVCLLGRGIKESCELGVARGLLRLDSSILIDESGAAGLRRSELLLLATGAQGERHGGMARIAAGQDAFFRCIDGDRVIFSSRIIPGNERSVRKLVNDLARQGAEVVQDKMALVHCSGHAHSEEQRDLIRIVRPRSFIPVHGERIMLEQHAAIARAEGVETSRVLVIEDGQSVVLSSAAGGLVRGPDHRISRRPMDASGRVLDWGDVRARSRVGRSGLAACSVVLDASSFAIAAPPALTFRGVSPPAALISAVTALVDGAFAKARARGDFSDGSEQERKARAEALVVSTLSDALRRAMDPVPELLVHVLTVDETW